MPYMGRGKTEGGVYVPDQARDRESKATVVAYVLKLGPLAYKDLDKFGDNGLGVRRATGSALEDMPALVSQSKAARFGLSTMTRSSQPSSTQMT